MVLTSNVSASILQADKVVSKILALGHSPLSKNINGGIHWHQSYRTKK